LDRQNILEDQETASRNIYFCGSPEPVTYTDSGDKITVNSLVGGSVNFLPSIRLQFCFGRCFVWPLRTS